VTFSILPIYFRTGSINETEIISGLILAAEDSFQHFFIYSIGPFRAFDTAYSKLWDQIGYGFGIYIFSSIHEPFAFINSFLGYPTIPSANQLGLFTQDNISIGNNISFNALYSGILPAFLDFNIFGVILIGCILGLSTSFMIYRSIIVGGIFEIFLASYLFNSSIMINYSWKLNSFASILPIIISAAYILLAKKSKSNLNN